MKLPTSNIGLGIATVVVLVGALWFFFWGGAPSQEAPLTITSDVPPLETHFLQLSNELSPISFNTTIFTDPRFTSLVDITTPINDEPTGRPDPFAPLSANAAISQ